MQNPVLTAGPDFYVSFYNHRYDEDAVSKASNPYVGVRRSAPRNKRYKSASTNFFKLKKGAHTFYPGDYYDRVGYQ